MAKRTKVRVSSAPPAPPDNPVMDAYGLRKGDHLRFETKPGIASYDYGVVLNDNKDGSITIYTDKTRSIMPERCQRKRSWVGPRGGMNEEWVDLT